VASIIERIDFDCPINLMFAIISLTAPLEAINARPVIRFQAGLANLIYGLNGS
jgi:hypothetical protein